MLLRKRKATQKMPSPMPEDIKEKKRKAVPSNDMDEERKFKVDLEDYDAAADFFR
jgi:hypothetical protein